MTGPRLLRMRVTEGQLIALHSAIAVGAVHARDWANLARRSGYSARLTTLLAGAERAGVDLDSPADMHAYLDRVAEVTG